MFGSCLPGKFKVIMRCLGLFRSESVLDFPLTFFKEIVVQIPRHVTMSVLRLATKAIIQVLLNVFFTCTKAEFH